MGVTASSLGERAVVVDLVVPLVVVSSLVPFVVSLVVCVEGASFIAASTSADPDLDVDARLPCLAMRSRDEQIILLAVLILKVLW